MQRRFLLVAIIVIFASAVSCARAQDDAPAASSTAQHSADVLEPPPLPKLEKGEWAQKQMTFPDALSVQDSGGNDLGKALDLPGTSYTAQIGGAVAEESEDNPIYLITSAYEKELAAKDYNALVKLPDSHTYLQGATEDDEEGGVYGQSVIAEGKLRFIAVSDSKGEIEIFVSDEMPLSDLAQKISAKTETPEPK